MHAGIEMNQSNINQLNDLIFQVAMCLEDRFESLPDML